MAPWRRLPAVSHDLIDLGGELRRAGREHQPADVTPEDRAHAHRARFARGVERRAAQHVGAALGEAAADRHHLAVRGRVASVRPRLRPRAMIAPSRTITAPNG